MVARLRRADRGTSCALSARCFEAEARALPVSGAWRLEGHDVATSVATALNHRLARRRPKPEQRAEQVIPVRRSGLEPPPTKCGPGPQPGNPGVRSYASIASDVSALLDGMDATDDLDVAADVATAPERGLGRGRGSLLPRGLPAERAAD